VFGEFDYSFRYDSDDLSLWFERSDSLVTYNRRVGEHTFRKFIGGDPGRIIINPVEPVNLPEEVTRFLEIHFTSLVLGPESSQVVYLTFPVEIGVFLESKGDYDVLDIFTLAGLKYSLYGPAEEGIITRYAESQVHDRIPDTDLLHNGVLALSITNSSRSWVEVSRIVIDAGNLTLFYGDTVYAAASMTILSRDLADIRIAEKSPEDGMKQSVLVLKTKKTLIPDKMPFMMEYGVGDR
jgi:hypothetical protein